jgi:hypothetical protein
MSCYDYDYEPNYPEVEEIIENATDGFSKFLHETFVDEYKNIETAKQNNKAKEKALHESSQALDKKERELKEWESNFAKKESEAYGKFKAKWLKELGLNFDIGDTAYYLKDATKRVKCPSCNGTGNVPAKIELGDNKVIEKKVSCPTCQTGYIDGKKEYEIVEAKVVHIEATICKTQNGSVGIKGEDWYGGLNTYIQVEDKKDCQPHSMRGEKLYKTREEAESHITKK